MNWLLKRSSTKVYHSLLQRRPLQLLTVENKTISKTLHGHRLYSNTMNSYVLRCALLVD